MTRSIEEMSKNGEDIKLVTAAEEALMDSHRRHSIAYIRESLGLARVAARQGDVKGARENINDAISGVRYVLNKDFPIDKAAFLERVIAEVEKIRDMAVKTMPEYVKFKFPQFIGQFTAMREHAAQQYDAPEPVGMR